MDKFIKDNNLEKRLGHDEWYSSNGMVRVVKIGDRWRMDVAVKPNWSVFKSDYIVGHHVREFKTLPKRRRW